MTALGSPGQQLGLGMWLRESATFDNFVPGSNDVLLQALRQACDDHQGFIFFWGPDGEGKSHLLQAACNRVGEGSVFLPLGEPGLVPEMLDGLEQMRLVAIDNLAAVAGDRTWETALFNLYNRIRDQGRGVLIVAAEQPLASVGLTLPDLQSRLAWGLVFQLRVLSDEQKISALQQRARGRGIELNEDVATYLLRHCRRDMAGLFELLDRLDQASLAEQRRLTIPFVKLCLEKDAKHN